MMDRRDLEDMKQKLEFGYQLSHEQTRWLWNACVQLARGVSVMPRDFTELGPIVDHVRCMSCNGTGYWGESADWGMTHPLACLRCGGTGYVFEGALVGDG